SRRQRADLFAGRVEKTDDKDLVLDEVVPELEDFAILADDGNVGHVAPIPSSRGAGCCQQGCEDAERDDGGSQNPEHAWHGASPKARPRARAAVRVLGVTANRCWNCSMSR